MATSESANVLPGTSRSPRRFYIGLSALVVVLVFVGFWPTYFGPLFAGTVDRLPIIHLHAAVYVGWLALFATQIGLAAAGHRRAHMRLGKIGIGYGIVIIIVGTVTAFSMFAVRVGDGLIEQATQSLLSPLVDMVVFAPFFAAAVYYRRKPELHKRLMIVATTSLLIAAVGRMRFLGSPPNVALVLAVWLSPILAGMVYDYVRHRLVHFVYVVGAAVIAAEYLIRREVRVSDTWLAVGAWLATFFA